jgi:hypothetical protein
MCRWCRFIHGVRLRGGLCYPVCADGFRVSRGWPYGRWVAALVGWLWWVCGRVGRWIVLSLAGAVAWVVVLGPEGVWGGLSGGLVLGYPRGAGSQW